MPSYNIGTLHFVILAYILIFEIYTKRVINHLAHSFLSVTPFFAAVMLVFCWDFKKTGVSSNVSKSILEFCHAKNLKGAVCWTVLINEMHCFFNRTHGRNYMWHSWTNSAAEDTLTIKWAFFSRCTYANSCKSEKCVYLCKRVKNIWTHPPVGFFVKTNVYTSFLNLWRQTHH